MKNSKQSSEQVVLQARSEQIQDLLVLISDLYDQVENHKKATVAVVEDCRDCQFEDETGYFVGVDVISDLNSLLESECTDD